MTDDRIVALYMLDTLRDKWTKPYREALEALVSYIDCKEWKDGHQQVVFSETTVELVRARKAFAMQQLGSPQPEEKL